MQRRGGSGSGQPVTGQRHRTIRPKARKAPTARVFTGDLQEQLDRRTRELSEALEQQTATAEVLSVISSSPTKVQPVFDAIVKSVAQLCRPQFCWVFRFDGGLIHFEAEHGLSPKGHEAIQKAYPMPPGRATAAARSILSCAVEEIPDVRADPDYAFRDVASAVNFRSIVAVPMLKDGRAIGTIAMARSHTGRFPERQVELLRTFADQAVIAIENVRLFDEVQARTRDLSESLQQQTATADVLKVISHSTFSLQTVLDTLTESSCTTVRGGHGRYYASRGPGLLLRYDLRLPARTGRLSQEHEARARARERNRASNYTRQDSSCS